MIKGVKLAKKYGIIVFIFFLGGGLRFFNLGWGRQYFFHPDERNIASAITRMHDLNTLDPHFFAYGSLPIYLVYFLGGFLKDVLKNDFFVSFEGGIVLLRFLSAVFNLLTGGVIYLIIAHFEKTKYWRYLGLVVFIFMPGMIQAAHFGTYESMMAFFYSLLFLVCLLILKSGKIVYFILGAVISGVCLSIKTTSLVFLPFPLLCFWRRRKKRDFWRFGFMFLIISLLVCFLTSPFYFLNYGEFFKAMNYEGRVALGKLKVFYTGQFEESVPVFFQFKRILPFVFNPLGGLFLAIGIFLLAKEALFRRKKKEIILFLYFSAYFLSNCFLFVKWTRYIIPILPIGIVIVIWFLKRMKAGEGKFLGSILALVSIFYGLSFFTIYKGEDTRVEAAKWLSKRSYSETGILSEVYDLGIVPFNRFFNNIVLFNFYELDNERGKEGVRLLCEEIKKTKYIIVLSRRIWKNRIEKSSLFPKGANYYGNLFDGSLGFEKIKEFDKRAYIWPDERRAEETFKVFDHPKVMIFEKKEGIELDKCMKLIE